MKGIDDQTTGSRVGGNEANRGEAEAVIFVEKVDQPALATIGPEFLVNFTKDLRGQHFDLSVHLV